MRERATRNCSRNACGCACLSHLTSLLIGFASQIGVHLHCFQIHASMRFLRTRQAQTKSFYIDLKENSRGRYVKIAEKGRL